ncbi:MAG TPA: Qat anti-phage system associated protein QatB [Bryobacteraceae bacterium]|nr:Qat anti-phage system associated protein QatB [Bryobacteraceae bacterium]
MRQNFGKFAQGGKPRDLRRGLRAYVRKGYSGRSTATQRFGGTATTANALYGALSSIAGGEPAAPGSPLDPALLAGRSAREVMDAVVEAVRPTDGTQDAEANRTAIKDALSDLLVVHPDADLLNLTEEQRGLAIERFVAFDIFQRIMLDVGTAIQEKAPTASAGSSRIKEVKDYIRQAVAASFRRLSAAGERVTKGKITQVVRAAIAETFRIFEGYAV